MYTDQIKRAHTDGHSAFSEHGKTRTEFDWIHNICHLTLRACHAMHAYMYVPK